MTCILSTGFIRYMECKKDSPMENFEVFGTERPIKIDILPVSVEKLQHFKQKFH